MGNYLNKGNDGFASLRNSKFVDKSMLIAEVNSVMMTENRFLCVTRTQIWQVCRREDAECVL